MLSIRVPKELKERMKRYRVDWSKEIRTFIEERVKALEFLDLLNSVEKNAERSRLCSAGFIVYSKACA